MNHSIEQILNNTAIPTPPTVAMRLVDLVTVPNVDVNEVTRVLGADPKLSGKIIDYCNSPLVGAGRNVGSLKQAVVVLGMRSLRLLSLSFSLTDTLKNTNFDYDSFWHSSLATAIAAKSLSIRCGRNADEDFLLGLVFNIGLIGIWNTFHKDMKERLGAGMPLEELNVDHEREILGVNRYEVGAKLIEKWNFPERMVEVLATYDPAHLKDGTKLFYVAQRVSELLLSQQASSDEFTAVKLQAESLLAIEDSSFDEMFDEVVSEWKSYESLFQFDSVAVNSIEDLERRAKESMIQISLGMESEIREIAEQNKDLEASVYIDALTGLKNRTAYESEVPGLVEYHRRQHKSIGLIVLDIDRFKSINDNYGHSVGDMVLRAIGNSLAENSRVYDNNYRYGGEEFVSIIMDCDFESVKTVANRFREAIENLEIEFGSTTIKVTTSLGVCWAENGHFYSIDELFNVADSCLYEAKNSGRNRCIFRILTSPVMVDR